jgi:hypothetical protein
MSEFNYPLTQFLIPEEQNTQIKDGTKTSGMKLRFTSSKVMFTVNYIKRIISYLAVNTFRLCL